MSETVIRAENVGKLYRLGEVGTGTLSHDLNRWWHKVRGKEDPYLKIGHVNKAARKTDSDYFWALKDINFEVKRGEVLGIIGRNGAGKSTLLKILSRVTLPTKGEIKVKGRIASLLEVGTGFHPELTGRENIFLNGAILGMTKPEIKKKFDEIVDFADVDRYIDTPVKRYSSGMYVRLAFAVAAHLEPEILIVDEVLAVGDAAFQKKCLGKMRDVATGGRTVLFVSHQIAAIQSLTTRCILLNQGTILYHGETAEALECYSSAAESKASRPRSITRPKWAVPIIQKVDITNNEGNAISQISLGEGCTIEVTIDSSPTVLTEPVLGIVVSSVMQGAVAGLNTRMKLPDRSWKPARRAVLKARFTELPFTPGRYFIDVWIGNGSADLDTVPEAAVLDIIPDDVYRSGLIPLSKHGSVLLYPTWSMDVIC